MPAEYRYRRRVQFAETDLAGMVHFTWYLRYMEEAEHALWRSVGLSIAPPDEAVRFPRVAVSCNFKTPLRFEDEIEIHVKVADLSRRSIRYECAITRDDETVATGSMTIACIDTAGGTVRPIEIPAGIAERLGRDGD